MSSDFHTVDLLKLILLYLNGEILTHLKEVTEKHLLAFFSQSLESHLLDPHQVLFAVEIIDLHHTLLPQFYHVHNLRSLLWRLLLIASWGLLLFILIR